MTDFRAIRSATSRASTTRETSRTWTSSRRGWRSRRSTPAPAATAARRPTRYVHPDQGRRVAAQTGTHAMKFGRQLQLPPRSRHPQRQRAFRDADVLRRSVGDPQQHATAAIRRASRRPASCGSGSRPTAARSTGRDLADTTKDAQPVRARGSRTTGARRRDLTLNLGVRYDIDFNFCGPGAPTRTTRRGWRSRRSAIRTAACRKTPNKDISPRVGFAYDLAGDGRRVLRGGYGLYFDQINTAAAAATSRRRASGR